MCGIAAGLGTDAAKVRALLDGVAHRGPDAARTVASRGGVVGAARLRMVGADARSDMPLASGRVAAAWNGEAFNHAEMAPPDAGRSDLWPVVEAFLREGAAAFERVRGPYAATFLDVRDDELTLARDPLGVRPLYLRVGPTGVAAASEPWPLIADGPLPPRIDADALAHLLAFQFPPPDRGLVRGVDPLAPGAVRRFVVDGGGVRERPAARTVYGGSDEGSLAATLRRAAALQGPCARRTALFLSGGLDSSAVLGLLAAAGAAPQVALVGWFPDGGAGLDERPHARAAAAALGVRLREVAITAESAWAYLPAAMRGLGGPCGGPGVLSAYALAETAAKEGAAAVFTGQGGDELFGGYERHRLLDLAERGLPLEPAPGYEPLAAAMRLAADPLRAAVVRGDALRPLLEPEAAAAMDAAVAAALPPPGPGRVDRALAFERRVFLPGLLAVDDRALGAFGLEGRTPLLDPAVARIAERGNFDDHRAGGAPRDALRTALGAALPACAAARRDKMGFPMPLRAWFAGPWRERTLDLLAGDALVSCGFRRGAAREAFERGALADRDAWFALALAVFERELAAAGVAASRARPAAAAAVGAAP